MTIYRLMDGQNTRPGIGSSGTQPPATVTSTSGDWLLGTMFSVSGQVGWLNGYWHWVPSNGDTTPRKFALWNVTSTSTQQVITGSVITSGTMTLGAFNFVALPTPIQIAPAALYVAAVGWSVPIGSGIPVSSNQFGSGNPYSAGITNGILTGWSSLGGTNKFPAATLNYGHGQNLFSNVLGSDPSVAMPNNGSGDDILWVDVSVSDTAPGTYSGSYRLWPNKFDFGNSTQDTANNFTLGLEFSLSTASTINNVWFYSPPTLTQLPTQVGVYQVSNTTLVANNSSPSWSGVAGSGWVSTPLTGTLQPGVNYKVVVYNGTVAIAIWNSSVANYWSTGFGASGLVSGPITAPNNASATAPGQASFHAQSSVIGFPDSNTGPFDYGVDIELTPVPASTYVPVLISQRGGLH